MKVVGARLPRYDGVGHVTGRTNFVDDVRVPGMLRAAALRSPHHNARITAFDTGPAEQMAGVHAVVTHEDVPLLVYGHLSGAGIDGDEPLLAKDYVRYKGQPMALVAADTVEIARAACAAIRVEYEELPALLDVRLAFEDDAPVINDRFGNWYNEFEGGLERRQIRKGDIDQAFDEADLIVEGVYRTQAVEQVPLETQVAVAIPEPDGRLTIHTCTQAMYFSLGVICAHLQVPMSDVKLVGGTVGGGFGGKVDTASETLAALAAQKSGRPVKWRWTREEEMLASSNRGPWHMEIIDAVSSDGWILGRKMLSLHDAGAYGRFSVYGLTKHSFHHTGAYTIPNLHFDGYVVFSNRIPTTAMRGYGVTGLSTAIEVHAERVATELGMDPYEFRLKNANRVNDTSPNRISYEDPSTVEVLQHIADATGTRLDGSLAAMSREQRSGDMLPDHLVAQIGEGVH
ncbi:xanthine dehydrogenase family protein molybdopterin-binding subunit [Candidatus Poriferisocius sp.]|uniref:xanthine dehydrogenase family protein molybdopterin-binding subunit n=1 Tax=Candidatus Poriferisocius sp. TaxID=3101276 RepID=UPI003B593217